MMHETANKTLSEDLQRKLAAAALVVLGVGLGVSSGSVAHVPFSIERVYAAENLATVAGNVFGCVGALWLLWHRCRFRFWVNAPPHPVDLGIANHLLAGYTLLEFGWAINRGYWYFFRILKSLGHTQSAADMVHYASIVSHISLVLVWCGVTLGASPALRYYFGSWWLIIAISFFAAVWAGGYQSPDLWYYVIGCGETPVTHDFGGGSCM